MCFSGSNTATQTTTQRPPKFIQQGQQQALTTAQEAAAQPFQAPVQPVAPFTPFQEQAFGQIQGMQGMTDPYYASAREALGEAGTAITQDDIERYLNPYADAALANMNKYIFGPQRVQTMGQSRARAGGPSADRLALTSQNLDFTQADALSQALAGFYSPAIAQAQRAKEMAYQSAMGWGNLGTSAQNAALQATGALGTAGNQQQAQQQAELMAPYNLERERLAYPFQTSQFLTGTVGALAPGAGGTTTGTTTTPSPSPLNQIAGLGTMAAGAFMGNPMMIAGGAGMTGSGKGSSYGTYGGTNPFIGGSGRAIYNRGGRAFANGGNVGDWIMAGMKMAKDAMGKSSSGGSVNPWDAGHGYDLGGPVIDADYTVEETPDSFSQRFSAVEPQASPPLSFGDRWNPAADAQKRGIFDTQGAIPPLRAVTPKPVAPPDMQPTAAPEPQGPLKVTVGPQPTSQPIRREPPPLPQADPSIDLNRLLGPREALPYPDATERDWGQRAVRSPWMALIDAGARIAQSKGGLGTAIGEGVQAGAKTIWDQRKELRSEEAINQRARALIQNAKSELDKYTKMTPYQKGVLEQGRFQQLPYTTGEGHPVILETKSGRVFDSVTREPLSRGIPLNQRTTSNRQPALVATAEWMVREGIAPDRETAFNRLKESASNKARFDSLVKEYVRIMMTADPTMDIAEAKRRAERIARGEELPE